MASIILSEKLIAGIACTCVLILGAVFVADARMQASQNTLPDLKHGPTLGSAEPNIPEGRHGNNLWIYGGECSQCSLNAINPEKLPYPYYDQVIVFYSAGEESLPKLDTAPNVQLISDPEAQLMASLNPQWLGRWYIFDNGELKRLQKHPDEPEPWSVPK